MLLREGRDGIYRSSSVKVVASATLLEDHY